MGKIAIGVLIGLVLGGAAVYITQRFVDLTDPTAWIVLFVVMALVSAGFEITARLLTTSREDENQSA